LEKDEKQFYGIQLSLCITPYIFIKTIFSFLKHDTKELRAHPVKARTIAAIIYVITNLSDQFEFCIFTDVK